MIRPDSKVYFGRCLSWRGDDMGAFKIGLAMEPEKRVASVASREPYICELVAAVPGDVFVECFVHMWLRASRLGGEFFKAEGEVVRLVEYAQAHKRLPFPIRHEEFPKGHNFTTIYVGRFMLAHGITFDEMEESAGVNAYSYRKMFERGGSNRRVLAALAVAAVKRNIAITWPLDFIPPKSQPIREAA